MSELKQREAEFEADALRINAGRKPKFGDLMRNPWASDTNPHRDAYFVRKDGRYYEFTDKKGEFWKTSAKYAIFIDAQPVEDSAALHMAKSLAIAIWEKHWREISPHWQPMETILGLISQIDNMTCTLIQRRAQPEANADAKEWHGSIAQIICDIPLPDRSTEYQHGFVTAKETILDALRKAEEIENG